MLVHRARLYRLIRVLCLSSIAAIVCVNAFLNIWWIIDCDYCVGHECGKSVCEGQSDHCSDRCYRDNVIGDRPIVLKTSSDNVSQSTEPAVYWQKLILKKYQEPIYLYSAFYYDQDNIVRIISKVYYGDDETGEKYDGYVKCVFLDGNQDILDTTDAKFIKFSEHYGLYETTRITCSLSKLLVIRPSYVKLVYKAEDVISEPILIEYPEAKEKRDIVVCVRPLFDYSSIRMIMEFIAYYRVNGVTKFVFYKKSVSDEVLQMFGTMAEFIEVYPWTMSDGTVDRIVQHNHEDQVAMTDDCLHRFRYHIILFIDIDEFLVPFTDPILETTIRREYAAKQSVGLSVRNVFFCCEFNDNNRKDFPRILHHFHRQSTIWMRNMRPKVVVLRPELVHRMGVHEIASLTATTLPDVKDIEPNDVLMFHYRSCCRSERTPLLWNAFSLKTSRDSVKFDNRMTKFYDGVLLFLQDYIQS